FENEKPWRAKHPLELIHTDVCGPMQNESIGGNRYFITFIDDYSRMCWVYFLRNKSSVISVFKKFKAFVELQSGFNLKKLRSDRGGEYTSHEFLEFCSDLGMERQLTIAYSPQQNGVSERRNRTICEMARSMMTEKKIPVKFWAEAVGTAVHIPSNLRQKFDDKASKGIFMGYGSSSHEIHSIDSPTLNQLISYDEHVSERNGSGTSQGSTSSNTPVKLKSLEDIYARCHMTIIEPETYYEAIEDKAWKEAMDAEIETIEKNGTWELVERPTDKPVIGVKWVFKTKLNLDGTVQKHKARLVAKGYAQKPGIDYNETFAPVARLDTIRTLIALAAQKGWKLFQLDVKSAFLNGVLEEEVYTEQPEGFEVKTASHKVYKLKKALYGLKQAPRACNALLSEFKRDMMQKYEMTDLGLLHHFLGMGVLQTENGVFIHQSKYAKSLLVKFGLEDCKSVTIPLPTGERLKKVDGSDLADEGLFRKIVGSLLYLTATRPDIMFAASLLSRFMHSPTKKHMGIAKRVLRYVQGTLSYGIEFTRDKNAVLIGFCDSDWAGSEDDSRSTFGYAFSFGSGVFSWASVKQNTVALSTAEAEYVSAAEATTQAIWLRFVLDDFGEMQSDATPLFCDNMSAISMVKNPVFHQKTRHINRRYHFIREALQEGVIDIKFCRSEEQLADIFTKALPKDRFNYLRLKLGVKPVSSLGEAVES
ncbi:unnamed protein product, partial [Prunus brigantina]